MGNYPFVLFRVAAGPNYDAHCKDRVSVDKVEVVAGLKYIFGFSEQVGSMKTYQVGHMEALAGYMNMSKFSKSPIGVYLSAELLVETPWRDLYAALETVPNWKYVIVRVGYLQGNQKWDTTQEKIRCMKYLLRYWNRETILDANWEVWKKTYFYEDIPDPGLMPTTTVETTPATTTESTPTTPTTSTTPRTTSSGETTTNETSSSSSSTKTTPSTSSTTTNTETDESETTEETTTIITPSGKVTLTSHPPETTAPYTFATKNITFPTLKPNGGERLGIRWRLGVWIVGVVGVINRGVLGN